MCYKMKYRHLDFQLVSSSMWSVRPGRRTSSTTGRTGWGLYISNCSSINPMISKATGIVPASVVPNIQIKRNSFLRVLWTEDSFYCKFYSFKANMCVLICYCVYQLQARCSSVLWCFVVVCSN